MSTYEIFMVILTIAILVVEIIKLVSKDNKNSRLSFGQVAAISVTNG